MTTSSTPNQPQPLAFVPFNTFIDPSFWSDVNRRKLNEWQLDTSPKPLQATYTCHGRQVSNCTLSLSLSHHSLVAVDSEGEANTTGATLVEGQLLLANTKKEFLQEMDRKHILEELARTLWSSITSRHWLSSPSTLNTFCLTAFADVKQYSYTYWSCIPALLYPSNIHVIDGGETAVVDEELFNLATSYNDGGIASTDPFIILRGKAMPLGELITTTSITADEWSQLVMVFHNPSTVFGQPGWPLRNLLAGLAYLKRDRCSVKVLALRRHKREQSFTIQVGWTPTEIEEEDPPKAVGWERDAQGNLCPRQVDLKSMFDPLSIMEQSVDLNLKLIRWRQAPTIELDRFTSLRALLLGSGTLGCNLARALLGWGVKRFTFVDHAFVSYNNPIRQSLFTFEDCGGGQHHKAQAAANALKRIYPLVKAEGVDMKIPMPGHPFSESEEASVRAECNKLAELIFNHDVVFLVMDSRESRWLPTLLASLHNKLAITVALGFDSYVVLRHGVGKPVAVDAVEAPLTLQSVVPGAELGCYFCSDVTAPGNSMADRTLDQQCTISRSGISMIASGMAVELLASVLQHQLGAAAPARLAEVDENSSLLGATPHQLRGFLSRFHMMTPTVRRFDQCTACGVEVRRAYLEEGFDFLARVFKDPAELERVSGLTELQASADGIELGMMEIGDDDDSI